MQKSSMRTSPLLEGYLPIFERVRNLRLLVADAVVSAGAHAFR